MKRIGNIIEQIVDEINMNEAFQRVISEKRKSHFVRGLIRKKEKVLSRIADEIRCNCYTPSSYVEFYLNERGKERCIQSLPFKDRIALNAIMNVVGDLLKKSYIRDTYSSIKGRGIHDGLKRLRKGLRDKDNTIYCLKIDIRKFYHSIDQKIMMDMLNRKIKDRILLDTIRRIIQSYPQGLSIGYRSSQDLGNYYLTPFDHYMKEIEKVKYYYRYCDDIVVLSSDKNELHRILQVMKGYLDRHLKLTVKNNYQIFPVHSRGIDFLGYVTRHNNVRLRKQIKKKCAKGLHKVKSKRRRREITASAYGWMKHADCESLWYKLTGMKNFKELGLAYKPSDGKKRFEGNTTPLGDLQNCEIIILDFETDVSTKQGAGRYVVQYEQERTKSKFITNSEEMKSLLDQAREGDCFPFRTTIKREIFGSNKTKYNFT